MSVAVAIGAGNIKGSPGKVLSVTLTPGTSGLGQCAIVDRTDAGTTPAVVSLQAAANGNSVVWTPRKGHYCATGIRLNSIAGTGAIVIVEYE